MFPNDNFPGATSYWQNGELKPWDSGEVHVMSHVLHYGSSVFEGIRAYATHRGPAIFRLEEHIDRLFKSASVIGMTVPYSRDELIEACRLVMRENRLASAYIRPNLYYGYGNLGLTPSKCPVETTIGCWEWGAYLGSKGISEGVHVLLLPWKRIHHSQMNASVKLGGLYVQSNIFATQTRELGYDEGVFLNLENRVAEGPGENIIIVKDGVVKTNDMYESVLEGITRTSVMEIAKDLGYQTEIAPITVEDFFEADEAFFTGTAAEVTPITRITDSRDRSIPQEQWKTYTLGNGKPGEASLKLAGQYMDIVHGRNKNYDGWLTYVYDSVADAKAVLNGSLRNENENVER